jgi:hypothetical protein
MFSAIVTLLLAFGGWFLLPAPSATEGFFRATAEARSTSDPDGALQADAGSDNDPNGTPETDARSNSDPNG